MEDRIRKKVLNFARQLAVEEKDRLEAAGTLVDLELLTAEIGDELSRQLGTEVLSSRSAAVAEQGVHCCPDCQRECPVEPDREPLILQGIRGEIEYQEPRCYCPRCRRAFFPSGRSIATPAA